MTAKNDELWRKYVLVCNSGGTREQRASAFQRWRDQDEAEAQAARKASKRKKAEAVR